MLAQVIVEPRWYSNRERGGRLGACQSAQRCGLGLVWLEPRRYLRPAMRDFLNGTAIKRFRMVWAEVPLWVVIWGWLLWKSRKNA